MRTEIPEIGNQKKKQFFKIRKSRRNFFGTPVKKKKKSIFQPSRLRSAHSTRCCSKYLLIIQNI